MSMQRSGLRASILSAVHQCRASQLSWLRAISSQTIPAHEFEVIVVDASGEGTYQEGLRCFGAGTATPDNISFHIIERGGRARSLNRALDLARSDLIIFLADDFVVSSDFVAAHLRFHEAHPAPEAVGIGAGLLSPEFSTPFSTWLEETGKFFGVPFRPDMTEIPESFFYVGNASVKRELVDRAGRFNELFAYHAGDDFEFGQRLRAAGMRARYVPEAKADHPHPIDLTERELAMHQLGESARAMTARNGNHAWLSKARSLSTLWRLRASGARARLAISGSDAARANWWQTRLEAAFAEGYRNGSDAGGKSD